MLTYLISLIIVYFSVKSAIQLTPHWPVFETYGVSAQSVLFLQFSSILYIVSLAGLTLPFSGLGLLRPIPIGYLMLLPGILLGRKVSGVMDCVGIDKAAAAGRAANNIMWLGLGTGAFMTVIVAFDFIVSRVGNNIPF